MDQQSSKVFQQSLCESRSIVDNLDPVSARMISELQKQLAKVRGNLQLEKQRCRHMAGDHLAELKRLREESERRLDHSLRALELRKDQERMAEVKRVEDNLLRQKEQEVKLLLKQKSEDEKELRRKLQRQNEESLRYALEQERKLILEELQAKMPDEEVIAARESKLAKEVFSLGEENMRLEEQVHNLMHENRSQIEIMRRMKREQETEVTSLLRQNKSEAARDMAKLRLAENLMHQKHQDLVEVSQQATAIELERDDLLEEVTALKSLLSSAEKDRDKEKEKSVKEAGESARKMGPIQKRLEELEGQIRKLEDEKAEMKMENASLRKKLTQGGDPEAKANKDLEDRIKRLRKRNAELVAMTKNLDERCKVLKTESDRVHSKQVMETSEVEMQLKRTLSRQHAKDISDYTRQIHLRDKEVQELKRKLSKYEVSSSARHESAIELDKKLKALAMEKLRMEKMISKLCSVRNEDCTCHTCPHAS